MNQPDPATLQRLKQGNRARAEALIHTGAREAMRASIADIGGDEVFFVGRLDAAGMVEEAEAYAWGNVTGVPAILQHARPGDVIIHNHPSGDLRPSEADISVSSEAGQFGVGSYIVNCDVDELRVVVKPVKSAGLQPIDIGALTGMLLPGGRLAERLGGYEHRPQQIEMLTAVAEAFNSDAIAAIEAGTGTGKSMAYLLPAVEWARRNKEKVIISTGTINLQEQLIDKDLPLLKQASGLEFEAALLKGRNNYLCRRKTDYLHKNPDFAENAETRVQFDQIHEWVRTTREGSRGDLPFAPTHEVWERVMSDADNCMRARCPFYNECFFYGARRRAAQAHILVVNHHLLMTDLSQRVQTGNYTSTAVLPVFHRLILDEAHNLEDTATSHFGVSASRRGVMQALGRFVHPRRGTGLLSFLAEKIHEGVYELPGPELEETLLLLGRDLYQQTMEVRSAMDEAAEILASELDRRSSKPLLQPEDIKLRLRDSERETEFWLESVEAPLKRLFVAARPLKEGLAIVMKRMARFLDDATVELVSPLLEFRAAVNRLEAQLGGFAPFLADAEDHCRWIEYRRGRDGRVLNLRWNLAPLDIAPNFREAVLRRFRTIVMTSATLAVERKFDYFQRQIGAVDPGELTVMGAASSERPANAPPPEEKDKTPAPLNPPPAMADSAEDEKQEPGLAPPARRPLTTLLLDTPFDYGRQAYIAVTADLPDPTEPAFESALTGFLGPALEISRGRALVLFTSYSLLERTYAQLAPRLERLGYPCLRQGQNARTELTRQFREGVGTVLFATASFWEGVDVPGEALSCLVLTRLPFKVPGEPLAEARIEAVRREGRNPFTEVTVPQAVIKFRQGFGRLIRSHADRGAVLICDRRVATKRYGRTFLASLPSQAIHVGPTPEIQRELAGFFTERENE